MSYETNYYSSWTGNQMTEDAEAITHAVVRRRGGWGRGEEQQSRHADFDADQDCTSVSRRMRVGPLGAYLASLSRSDDY